MRMGPFLAAGVLLLATACDRGKPFHNADVTGTMPDLQFKMVRASDGLTVSAAEYRGRVALLYFGYTNCPDVCPTTLAYVSEVLHRLGRDAEKVRVLFVTVDPKRDTFDVLKPYAASFGVQVDGLRGSKAQIADVARRYRVSYSVKERPDYVVTHSASIYVFDDKGRARLMIADAADTEAVAQDVNRIANGD